MQPWNPLSGAQFEDAFGPTARDPQCKTRVRTRRDTRRMKSKLHVENLEIRAVPTVTTSIIGTSLSSTQGNHLAVGEIVRYRVTASLPSDNSQSASLGVLANLPPGLTFVNDGTAHMAIVSNGGVTSSLAPAGSNLFAAGDDSNVDSISPTHLVTPSILTGGRQILFSAGQVNDFDNDANNEYVVIEFNALVNNTDGGVAASATVVVPDSVATAAITGFIKCLDTPGEPGINGVTLRLLDANGGSIATTVTHTQNGLDGYYEFTNLEAGTYTVVEDDQNLPTGVTNGHSVMVGTINGQTVGMQGADSQGNDEITNITIADGQTGVMYCFLDFCMMQPPAKITGFVKCVDKPNEDGINGVTMRLYDAAGNLLATTLTHNQNGLDGYYEFTNLAPGTYRIVEDDQNLPPGITDANVIMVGTVNGVVDGMSGMDAQGNDYITNIRLNAGDMGMMYCFLDFCMPVVKTSQLSGFVFCDDNGNGHLDPGEHVFSDVMIRLTGGNLTAPQFTTTDVNGVYSFTNLAPGTYQIHLVDVPPSFRVGGVVMLPLNVFRATPGTIDGVPVGTGTISFINDVALPGNSSSINNDFPLLCVTQRAPVSISGHAYYDSNRDCNFESVDRSLAGVIVHALAVDDTGHVVLDQQSTTDNDGRYAFVFSPLTLGRIFKFRISFTTPSGYTFEAAKAGDFGGNVNHNEIDDVDLTDGNDAVGYDACYVRDVPPPPPPSKSDFLANGNASGSGLGGTVDFGQVITNPSFNNINPGQRTGVRYLVTGADSGGGPHVRVFDYLTGREVFSFLAYSPTFTGGVRVATGDVNGDGISDIITAPGFGGGPVVRVWDGATGALIDQFNAYGPSFRGGVYVAVGDINGDGRDEIITGAGEGGGPHVKVFSVTGTGPNISVSQTAEFMAYDSSFRGGVRVAAADFNNDGFDDIVTGAGIGGGPHVKVFDMQQPTNGSFALITQFMAFEASFRGGVFVAAGNQDRGDVTGDGRPDFVVGMGVGGNTVKVFSGTDFSLFAQFDGFAANTSGVRVGLLDVNGDGRSEVLVGSGPQYGAFVRAVNLSGTQRDLDFFAPYGRFLGGVFVAGS